MPEYINYFVPCQARSRSPPTQPDQSKSSIIVHMDMDQPVDHDSSNDTGSFEKAEGTIQNYVRF